MATNHEAADLRAHRLAEAATHAVSGGASFYNAVRDVLIAEFAGDCTCIPYHTIGCPQYAESWQRRAEARNPAPGAALSGKGFGAQREEARRLLQAGEGRTITATELAAILDVSTSRASDVLTSLYVSGQATRTGRPYRYSLARPSPAGRSPVPEPETSNTE